MIDYTIQKYKTINRFGVKLLPLVEEELLLAHAGEFAPALNLVVAKQFGSCLHRGSQSGEKVDTAVELHFLPCCPIPHSMERFTVVVRANCSTVKTPVFCFSLALDLVPLDIQENIF